MLSALSLVALLAEPTALRSSTVMATVTSRVEPVLDLSSGLLLSGERTARMRLGLSGMFGLGRFASTLASSFAHWSISVGVDAETVAHPDPRPPDPSGDGMLVAHIGHGLYVGHGPPLRPELLSHREYLYAKPSLFPSGVQIGVDGTLFLTRNFGLRIDVRGGSGMYFGLSLIYQPGR